MKRALVTGITGQDGSYLAEFLLQKGYEVYGLVRRTSVRNDDRLEHIKNDIHKIDGDLTDQNSLATALRTAKPDEVYHLGAQSFVPNSWDFPDTTVEITGSGTVKMLEAIRHVDPSIKFYQASSSEMFGKVQEVPQREETRFYPRSPYGCAKVLAHHITVNFRESYNIFGVSGILFNHESPRRGLEFVTRKITHNVAKISKGLEDKFSLGNLSAERDWGFAGDYVQGMWMMLQHDKPETYILATNKTNSIRHFVELAFNEVGKEIEWVGEGVSEKGVDRSTGRVVVEVDPKFFRPAEVEQLRGDYSKIKNVLGWEPKVKLNDLVSMMVKHDMWLLENHKSVYYPEKVDFSTY
ncbi:MAG: GDP-mannose 4,6-dehydratase [archaeon]